MADKKPKYRNGQTLINKATGKEITIKNSLSKRLITKNYSGFIDEFTGEYNAVSFDNKGKTEQIQISEDTLDLFYETRS